MSIPSDFDPIAWDERWYIQPVIKRAIHPVQPYVIDYGITDETYPYIFKMVVVGTGNNGCNPNSAFDASLDTSWGSYGAGDFYCVMTFEQPLRIVGMQMLLMDWRQPTFKLYGIVEGEDTVTEGTLLGGFTAKSTSTIQYQCLATANRSYYRQYRIDFHCTGGWNHVYDIRLDAYYRPADLQG